MHLEYFTKVKCEILAAGAVLRSKSLSKHYAIVEISQPGLAQSVQAAAVRESRLSHIRNPVRPGRSDTNGHGTGARSQALAAIF
jgi:hypothetical protein